MQNGATSIVGQCIIQIAKFHGIHSINILRDRCFSNFLFKQYISKHAFDLNFNTFHWLKIC